MKTLFVTDGSPSSKDAATLLSKIAHRAKAQVTVLSVASRSGGGPASTEEADETAATAAAELAAAGFQTVSLTRQGRPADEILRVIEEQEFDLAVMGAGQRKAGSLLLGSVSNHILHNSPSSVLITREASAERPEGRVLVGVDGSPEAGEAVTVLIDLADPARCSVDVVAVAEVRAPTTFPGGQGYALSLPTEEMEAEVSQDARRFSEQAAKRLRSAGFPVEAKVVLGRAQNRLLAEAKRLSSDLVAVGSRGLGALNRALLGSVSQEVTKSAPAALVVKDGRTPSAVGDRAAPGSML